MIVFSLNGLLWAAWCWPLWIGGHSIAFQCRQDMGAFLGGGGLGFLVGVWKKTELADAQKPVGFKRAQNALSSPADTREGILF